MSKLEILGDLVEANELNRALEMIDELLGDNIYKDYYPYLKAKKLEIAKLLGLKQIVNKEGHLDTYHDSLLINTIDDKNRDLYERVNKTLESYAKIKALWTPYFKYFETIGSTNDYLEDNPEEKIALAGEQTKGKGQRSHSFYSPTGGMFLSVKVEPRMEELRYLTASAGVKVSDALARTTGKRFEIKWINDLYLDGRKVCGILTEPQFDFENNLSCAIIGIGINLVKNDYLPKDIENIYGYIIDEIDEETFDDMRRNILYYLIPDLLDVKNGIDIDTMVKAYNERLYKKGQEIKVEEAGFVKEGVLKAIDREINLILETSEGEEIFSYSDTRILK